jgi:hypothetical protein
VAVEFGRTRIGDKQDGDGGIEMPKEFELTSGDLELIRQWFDSVQDLNEGYLDTEDFELAKKIYERLGVRVPNSIIKKAP